MPEIYVFGGCNGSGKTTLATKFLSTLDNKIEFVNADMIAAELNPNDVDSVAIQASRIMRKRLDALSQQYLDFAFETTLAARTFAKFLRNCKSQGYQVNLIYVWLNSSELAVTRVARRVASGGHNIPQDIIIRRYERGRKNFIDLYLEIAERWIVYDNSQQRQKIAEKPLNQSVIIYQSQVWQQITRNQL